MTDAVTLSGLESHLWEAANIYRCSPVDRRSAVRRMPKSVGTALANALRGVAAAGQIHLHCVIGEANRASAPDELLKDRIEHFSVLSPRVASDVRGDAYEDTVKQFAGATSENPGQFYAR